jgi:hypothetical protein
MGILDDLNKIANAFQKGVDELNKPESFSKGEAFERYIKEKLFPDDKYQLLHQAHDYNVNKERYVEESKEPDFQFRSRLNKKELYIEAKFRADYFQDAIEICKPFQLKRYQDIDKKTPVFIALGIGGESSSPEQVFIIPIKEIKYTRLFRSFLKNMSVREINR